MPHNPNYDAAVRLATAGLAVFPLRAHDRRPLVKWASESSADTAVVTRWWQLYPQAMPGLDLAKCGLVVLDGDRHDPKVDGVAALQQLLQEAALPPGTVPVVRTPRDGAHAYFRQPSSVTLTNRPGNLPAGVDIRGHGGFVVAPGAVLPDGRRYEPLKARPDLALAFAAKAIPEVPTTVIALVAPPRQRARAGTQHSGPVRPRERAYAKAALRRSASELAATAAGGRNQRLNKSAFVLGTMVARDWISREEVEDALTAAMERNGYVADKGPRAVEATLASGLNAGLASPHDDLLESESPREGAEPTEVDIEIARLAALAVVEYENQRREAAEALGVRTPVLDKLVEAERSKLNPGASDGRQGRAVAFPEPEPWPDSVDGAALLDGIAGAVRDHVVMSDSARDQTALWVVHAYMIDRFLVSPRLGVTSPVKGCGKTTLLDVLGRLVPRPLPTANITPAALFRVVESYRPTLLVDEADSFLRDADELRGVLNSGHRKGGTVLRTVGDDHEPRAFGTYCATAIALIGQLPDTLHDRAVIVGLKRRLRTEAVTPYRSDRAGHLDELARKAARWAKDHADFIAECDPGMPEGIVNRTADNWRPLLAVAEVAGGDWPERARKAAEAARIAAADDEASRLEALLTDIRDIGRGKVSMASAELVEGLVAIEGRPWADGMGRNRDKPLTANRLASMLKAVKVTPEDVWIDKKALKGYAFERFTEAFGRYLPLDPSAGVSEPRDRESADETGTSEPFRTARPEPTLAVRKRKKPNNGGHPRALAVRKGGTGKSTRMRASNGQGAPGPSPSEQRVAELVRWCVDRRGKGGRRDREAVEAGLRTVLQEELAPALVEAAFQRVIVAAFGC